MEKTDIIKTIAVFPSHRLIQANFNCLHCNGTLFRQYSDGTLVCVKCLSTVFNSEPKKEQN